MGIFLFFFLLKEFSKWNLLWGVGLIAANDMWIVLENGLKYLSMITLITVMYILDWKCFIEMKKVLYPVLFWSEAVSALKIIVGLILTGSFLPALYLWMKGKKMISSIYHIKHNIKSKPKAYKTAMWNDNFTQVFFKVQIA